jgi:hypothetical protein
MKLGELADLLKKNKLITQLQTTGGFAIKSIDRNILSYLQVENVYERLGYLSDNNIVATSECIKGPEKYDNIVFNMLSKPIFKNVNFYGCDKDTGFVIDSIDTSISVKEVLGGIDNSTVCSVLNLNGIKIASIHLPGDGPKNQTIADFLDQNLRNLISENVDVVCGDTNITDGKSLNILNSRIDDITQYFNHFFGGPCVIINSNVRVGKHRRGFILRNQQLKKSVPESTNDTEADGTIIAIKLKHSMNSEMHEIIEKLKVLNNNTHSNIENALEFKVEPSKCLGIMGEPIEKIWLDHSVLYIDMVSLCYLTDHDYLENYPRNLIVINMGSIVNAGFKSWNTRYLPYQNEINIADKDIYKIICKYNSKSLFPNYEDIFGSNMLFSVDSSLISTYGKGVDNINIDEPSTEMMDEINDRISRLMLLLGQHAGKKYNKKSRKKVSKRKKSKKLYRIKSKSVITTYIKNRVP